MERMSAEDIHYTTGALNCTNLKGSYQYTVNFDDEERKDSLQKHWLQEQ
jgi:hypothetical protein